MKSKAILSVLIVCLVSGCAGPKSADVSAYAEELKANSRPPPSHVGVSAFEGPTGLVKVSFDSDGNWESISTVANAAMADQTNYARQHAVTVATLKAKRNLSEFLGSQIKSKKTLNVLSESAQKGLSKEGQAQGGEVIDPAAFKLAEKVQEEIVESSNAILKGLIVIDLGMDESGTNVIIEVKADPKLINSAKRISFDMNSPLKVN
jgi:hypothetical protein